MWCTSEIKTLGNSLQGCVQGFRETNKRSSVQGQEQQPPGSEDRKQSQYSWSLERGREWGSWWSCSLLDKDTRTTRQPGVKQTRRKPPHLQFPPVLRLHVSDPSGKADWWPEDQTAFLSSTVPLNFPNLSAGRGMAEWTASSLVCDFTNFSKIIFLPFK